jgi:GT2 family glycosyltransferase
MGPGLDLSVIIVCYKSDEFIQGCIDSILTYSDLDPEKLEIIVVDNSPKDYAEQSFANLRKTFGLKNLRLIHNSHNGGYGQGNNIGIRASNGKYLCIMNPDVNLVEPIYSRVLKRFAENADLAMFGGRQLGGMNLSFYLKPEYEFRLITRFLTLFLNKLHCYHNRYMYLSGAFLFIDRAKFEEIGFFDENIFLYYEEPDITRRFAARNYQSCFDKSMPYRHLIEGRTGMSEGGLDIWLQSAKYYFHKFNLNLRAYLRQWIIFYMVIKFVYKVSRRKEQERDAGRIIDQFTKYLR